MFFTKSSPQYIELSCTVNTALIHDVSSNEYIPDYTAVETLRFDVEQTMCYVLLVVNGITNDGIFKMLMETVTKLQENEIE